MQTRVISSDLNTSIRKYFEKTEKYPGQNSNAILFQPNCYNFSWTALHNLTNRKQNNDLRRIENSAHRLKEITKDLETITQIARSRRRVKFLTKQIHGAAQQASRSDDWLLNLKPIPKSRLFDYVSFMPL